MRPVLSIDLLRRRIAQARALAASNGHEALLLCAAPRRNGGQSAGNVAHFTGYLPLTGATLMLLPVNGDPMLFAAGPNERRMLASRVSEIASVRQCGDFGAALIDAVDEFGLRRRVSIGVAGALELSAGVWSRLEQCAKEKTIVLKAMDKEIHALRAEVDSEDVDRHREASRISDAMIARAFEVAVEPNMSPARLIAEVEYAGRKSGAEIARLWLAVGSNPSVTSFEFFELPDRVKPGDRIQLGTTVCVEGHYSQGLRIAMMGEPEPALTVAADRLLKIQDAAAAAMIPGRPAHAVSDTLEKLIDESCPYSRATDPFRFQSCHQLGLDYSDAALAQALNATRDKQFDAEGPLLRKGQVLEIHPNYNLPGLGHVCMGDALVVTETGGEWLTRYPRGLTRLPLRS